MISRAFRPSVCSKSKIYTSFTVKNPFCRGSDIESEWAKWHVRGIPCRGCKIVMHGISPYRDRTKALSELYMREASTAPQQHSNWVRTDQCGTRRFRIACVPDWFGKGVVPDAASARGKWRGVFSKISSCLLPAVCDAVNRKVD
jgi:hypothetical protein